jgi:hypothetical protein
MAIVAKPPIPTSLVVDELLGVLDIVPKLSPSFNGGYREWVY